MAIAGGALVARSLGEGDDEKAQRQTTNVLIFGAVFGAIFAALVWFNLRPIVGLVGATGDTADLAVMYLQIITPFLQLLLVGMVGARFCAPMGMRDDP